MFDNTIPNDRSPIPVTRDIPYRVWNNGRDIRVATKTNTLWSVIPQRRDSKVTGYRGSVMKLNPDRTEELYYFMFFEGDQKAAVSHAHQTINIPEREYFLGEIDRNPRFNYEPIPMNPVDTNRDGYIEGENWNLVLREIIDWRTSGVRVDPFDKPFNDVGLKGFRDLLRGKFRAEGRRF